MMTKQLQTQGLLRKGFMLGISLVLLVNVNPIFKTGHAHQRKLLSRLKTLLARRQLSWR